MFLSDKGWGGCLNQPEIFAGLEGEFQVSILQTIGLVGQDIDQLLGFLLKRQIDGNRLIRRVMNDIHLLYFGSSLVGDHGLQRTGNPHQLPGPENGILFSKLDHSPERMP